MQNRVSMLVHDEIAYFSPRQVPPAIVISQLRAYWNVLRRKQKNMWNILDTVNFCDAVRNFSWIVINKSTKLNFIVTINALNKNAMQSNNKAYYCEYIRLYLLYGINLLLSKWNYAQKRKAHCTLSIFEIEKMQ